MATQHTSGSVTLSGKTYTVGATIYFTNYWQNCYTTAAAGVYSGKYSFYATIHSWYDGSGVGYPIRFTGLHNTSGTITSGGGYVNAGAVTRGGTCTVTLNRNGGSGGTASVTATYGAAMPSITKPSRTGYTFTGYFDATSGGNQYYNASGGSTKAWNKNGGATLYARWTANSITITYNANGGSGTMTNSTGSYGTAITLRTNTFTRSGYKFGGWATSATGAATYSDGQKVTNINNGGTTNLYAVWIQSEAIITFNANGGEGENYTQTVNQAVATQLNPNLFTKTGYHLLGWAESSDGEVIYTDGESITIPSGTSTKTLYAIWQINNYYINYIGNDNDYGLMSKQICTYNSPVNLYPNVYRKRKKSFKYWANLESFTKRISEEYSENNVTISYQLNDDEIFISASTGINQDGIDNPKGFNIIRGPFYNKQSRIVTVTGNGTSVAEAKEFYLDINIVDTSYTANLEITVSEIPSETVSFELKSGEQIIINSELTPQDFTSTTINVELKYPSKYITISCPTPEWAESINIISSGAEYDTYVNQATVLNLCDEHEETYNLYAIWQEGISKPVRIFNDIISYIGQNTYPVGSIFITSTNQNPSSFLWGEWKLVKKQFIPKTINNFIEYNTTNTQGTCNSVAEIYPTAINIKGYWYPKVAHADSTLTIGSYDLATLGLTECKQVPWVAVSDGLNSAFLTYINNTIQAVQVVPATNATSVAANASYPVYFNTFVMFENPKNMLDNACDKFFWKRIK